MQVFIFGTWHTDEISGKRVVKWNVFLTSCIEPNCLSDTVNLLYLIKYFVYFIFEKTDLLN